MWLFSDIGDYFGSVFVEEHEDEVIIGGINTSNLLTDITAIWKNQRLTMNMFTSVRKHRVVIDKFFLPDIKYVISQILEFRGRRSNKYRLNKVVELIDMNTWMKSTVEEHPDILDFSQLKNLKHTLFNHQIDTLKVYNEKVPKMLLKGFLLSTPPGCLAGDTIIHLKRNDEEFSMFLSMAAKCYNQDGDEYQNWDLKIPTYIRSYIDGNFDYHEIHSIPYSGRQLVFNVKLEDGNSINCSMQHPLKVKDGYCNAQDVVGKKVLCDGRQLHLSNPNIRSKPGYVKVVSFNRIGVEETYDVVCKEPHHNFVANNIVVHNSGKTIMSIALSQCLKADLSIYIVPKNTVTTVWFDGIQKELGKNAKIWASSHETQLTEDYDHYIFHYEALPMAVYLAKKLFGKRKKPFIAIDESHNLNEITSIRTLRLIDLVKTLNCQNTVFASGTPIKALGTEMIPLFRCIDPFFTDDVETRFKLIYGMTAKRAVDILRNRLGLISHKIAEDSYMTAPKPIEKEIFIKAPGANKFTIANIKIEMTKFMQERYNFYQKNMTQYIRIFNQGLDIYEKTLKTSQEKADLKVYRQQVKIIIENYSPMEHQDIARQTKEFEHNKILPALPQSVRKSFKDSISAVKFTRARCLGESLGWLSGQRALCTALIAQYANLGSYVREADKKTVIFSSYVPGVVAANNVLTKEGFKTLQVYGDFTKQITEIVNQFKTDPEANPIIATYKSLSASQTLTIANVALLLDVPFRDYIRSQSIHRIFRIGQDCPTYIFSFFLDTGKESNLSTRADEILKWSQQQTQSLFASMDKDEVDGIVKKLHLNKPSGFENLIDMIKNVNIF